MIGRRGWEHANMIRAIASAIVTTALVALPLWSALAQEPQPGAEPTPGPRAAQPPQRGQPAHPTAPSQATPPATLAPIVITPRPRSRARAAPKTAKTPTAATLPSAAVAAASVEAARANEAGLVKVSPLAGSEIAIGKVPGGVFGVSGAEVTRSGAVTVEDLLQATVPGVIISDLQGNAFQTALQYRGFTASPVDGVPQGLAVYQNGVRINEAFGDTLNWDFLPSVAINNITVMSNNPVFGLNALGGAISIAMKDGFTFQGVETDGRVGSFGRRQGSLQMGTQSGPFAAYLAIEGIHDDGFRDQGSSNIQRVYADLGVRGEGKEFHLNLTSADNVVGVAAASPIELLAQGWTKVFTVPQTTGNVMEMVSANGTVAASDTLQLAGVAYYRHFGQQHLDGNISSAQDCGGLQSGSSGFLCLVNVDGSATPLIDQYAKAIPTPVGGVGELDRTSMNANSYGASLQGVEKSKLFGHTNQALVGVSIDHGETNYGAMAEIGSVASNFAVYGTGAIVANSDIHPVVVAAANTYYGLYFSDTFDVTSAISLTAGGRYNGAQLDLRDVNGLSPSLTNSLTYGRFDPMVGATYRVVPGVAVYGGYSEANRAPVPAELACASATNPCLIPAFLTADPPLKQVVSHTVEAGIRGEAKLSLHPDRLEWSLGFFHTVNTDDIINGYSTLIGRNFVQNGGDTLRQGVEAKIGYRSDMWLLYASYNYVNATFQSAFSLNSPNNPLNPVPGEMFTTQVRSGNLLPGIPAHKFKAGFDYGLTPQWKVGADLLVASDQVFFGDEANQNARLPGYAIVNLHMSYDVMKGVQLYAIINNVLDKHFTTYGTYFDTASLSGFSDPRTIVPSQPFAAYGGIKARF
jgi:iron complex outermembrane recepter protein